MFQKVAHFLNFYYFIIHLHDFYWKLFRDFSIFNVTESPEGISGVQ